MDLLEKVGVLGGGRMGAGVAHAFVAAGSTVVVVERSSEAAEAASVRIDSMFAKSVERKSTAETLEGLSARVSVGTDYSVFGNCSLVVEAVPEDETLKARALRDVELAVGHEAWLATNTSALSVDSLAMNLKRPERFCGLHFFNPVPSSQLIEIVVGAKTSAELVDHASAWVKRLHKTPIVVRDSPGFASSRLGIALGLEAMRMVEDGVASANDIDAAMVLGYKHHTGPLQSSDIVGLDVRLEIANYLSATLGPRFAAPQILHDKVARGELGKKSGRGFFDWPQK